MKNLKSKLKSLITATLCVSIVLTGMTLSAHAAPPESTASKSVASQHTAMTISVGKSRIYKSREAATRISVADPTVADVMLLNPNELYILGRKTGATNIFVWHDQDRMSVIDVNVGVDTAAARDLLARLMPEERKLRVSSAGEALVLSGQVADSLKVQQAIQIAEEFSGKKVMNMLTTEDLPQVLLEVKVAEINKDVADRLGLQMQGSNFTFNMLGGAAALGFAGTASVTSGSTSTWLQAQVNSGLVKILAEPNIMAISGQEGQFLSGGKIFMPVPQSSSAGGTVITLQEENYGIGIKFTPTVLNGGRINLKVRPEVSQVSPNGVTVTSGGQTTVMPQIITRQASTTVQLQDGQSLAIGGLISDNVTEIVSAFPMLANIPIIGALFRSSQFLAGRSELLIVVTPRIVKPLDAKPQMPTDKYKQPSEAGFFLGGVMEGDYTLPGQNQPDASRAQGAAK